MDVIKDLFTWILGVVACNVDVPMTWHAIWAYLEMVISVNTLQACLMPPTSCKLVNLLLNTKHYTCNYDCYIANMWVWVWVWAYEHELVSKMEYFLTSFNDVDRICQEYFLPNWTKPLMMWQNILPRLYEWMNNKWTLWMKNIWKMLFVEEVWIAHVYGQGFKAPNIHSKSIIP